MVSLNIDKSRIAVAKGANKDMNVWQLIFFMFYDRYISEGYQVYCSTNNEIITALQSYYCRTESERLKDLAQGTISKSMKILSKIIIYDGHAYTIQKKKIPEQKRRCYVIEEVKDDSKKKMWYEIKYEFLNKGLLVPNQICIVSPYMYVFKEKNVIVRISKKDKEKYGADECEQAKKEKIQHQRLRNRKKIKNYFEKMIDSKSLFDVTFRNGHVTVMLNRTKDAKSFYSSLLANFFEMQS